VVVVYGVMSHKPPCPGINSIENKEETNYWSDKDEDNDDTIVVQAGGGTRSGIHAPRRLIFPALPLPRLKRQVGVPGLCSSCGRLTSESAPNVEGALYYCYSCYDNA
jgi:hypothetical protein